MKLIIGSLALVLMAFGSVAVAQPLTNPNMFLTLEACQEALDTGYFRFYEPRYFGLATQNPPNGYDRIVVPLESDTCLQMLVVGGLQFVVQREGTLFRARKLASGSLSLYARNDCGNPVYGVVFPATPPRVQYEPPTEPVRAPRKPNPPPPVRLQPSWRESPVARDHDEKRGGFCSSKKCRFIAVAIGGVAAGYAAWYYWPCPPGTVAR